MVYTHANLTGGFFKNRFSPSLHRIAVAAGKVRAVRGHGVRPEGGQGPHGADVLLARPAAVQPGGGPEQDPGREGPAEHQEPDGQDQAARLADETRVPRLVRGAQLGRRVADRCAQFDADRGARCGAVPRRQVEIESERERNRGRGRGKFKKNIKKTPENENFVPKIIHTRKHAYITPTAHLMRSTNSIFSYYYSTASACVGTVRVD